MIEFVADAERPSWWAVARDHEAGVVGVAMRTAPSEPYPADVLSMPDESAIELARTVFERRERAEKSVLGAPHVV